jgi:enamine deaminase RidA (YjgF/YER057c/UK114 family)
MQKTRIMPEAHPWYWSMPVKFSQGWKVEGAAYIFVGGQVSADREGNVVGAGDIEAQTHNVFRNIQLVLQEAGADMKDIVKLNTYYVYDGPDEGAKDFWEKMTRVRMQYLADPGPAGTAVCVPRLAYAGLLIEVEAIAAVPA